MAQKETTLGNYTSFPRFPLDCESMDYIQNNTKLLAVIAQIAGCDKLIIKGCTGSPRTEGYVYVRTGDDLVGEILYYPGGTGVRCSIATDNINIDTTANGETFANAYTKRMLVSGTTGTWAWSDFKALSEITNAALKAAVDGKAAANHNHDTAYAAKNHNHDTAYAAKSHTHAISEVSGLQSVLNGKAAATHNHDTAYAAKNHTHAISEVSGLQSVLNGKAAATHNHDTAYAAKNHNHDTAYAAKSHNHDERYYTEAEVDTKTAALQSAINAKQEQLASEVEVNNDHYKIKAVRYGKVVNVHINGYLTDSYSRTSITVPDSIFPTRLIPSQTVWAISIESNSAGTTNTLDNMHIAWLQRNETYNILEFGCIKSTQQQAHINATFTYILD